MSGGRNAIEETIGKAAASGALILGRGGMIVLRDVPPPCTCVCAHRERPAWSKG